MPSLLKLSLPRLELLPSRARWALTRALIIGFLGSLMLMASLTEAYTFEEPVEILVAAAASIAPYCQAMAREFHRQNPGVRVRFAFASSGHLRQQIEAGAPVDGFISASSRQMNLLEEKGLIRPATRSELARNRLVLVAPVWNAPKIKRFEDLRSTAVASIALGDPAHVPQGYYARATLKSLGLWQELAQKAIFGIDARQVLEYVRQGEVDAGFVYLSDAHLAGDKIRIVAQAPEGSHPPITYPLAVLSQSVHPKETEAFFNFLLSQPAQQALRDFGLEPAGSKEGDVP